MTSNQEEEDNGDEDMKARQASQRSQRIPGRYSVVQEFVCHPDISTSNQSTAANSLWYDIWFVLHLPAFLNLTLSSRWCF
jgi:hypothetical protein